jgi:hypothetical protein
LVVLAIMPNQIKAHDPKPSNTGMTISQMPNRIKTGIDFQPVVGRSSSM